MPLSGLEKETVVCFNEAEQTASIYTNNQKLRRKLEGLAKQRPGDCELIRTSHEGQAVEYIAPKGWVKINAGRVLSEEQKAAAVERGRKLADLRQKQQ